MQNKLEFGLKVLWDRDAVIAEIEEEDEDIRRLRSEIASQKGSTYFARMQYGRLHRSGAAEPVGALRVGILEDLRASAVAARINKPIGDKMILNGAFLVSRDSEARVRSARVKQVAAQHEKLTFKYLGPWPPYNFVNIRLEARDGHRRPAVRAVPARVHPRLSADRRPRVRARQGPRTRPMPEMDDESSSARDPARRADAARGGRVDRKAEYASTSSATSSKHSARRAGERETRTPIRRPATE